MLQVLADVEIVPNVLGEIGADCGAEVLVFEHIVEAVVPPVAELGPPTQHPALRPPFILDPPPSLTLVGPPDEPDVGLEIGRQREAVNRIGEVAPALPEAHIDGVAVGAQAVHRVAAVRT